MRFIYFLKAGKWGREDFRWNGLHHNDRNMGVLSAVRKARPRNGDGALCVKDEGLIGKQTLVKSKLRRELGDCQLLAETEAAFFQGAEQNEGLVHTCL